MVADTEEGQKSILLSVVDTTIDITMDITITTMVAITTGVKPM